MSTCTGRRFALPPSGSADAPGWRRLQLSLWFPARSSFQPLNDFSQSPSVHLKAFVEVLYHEVFQGIGLLFCWKWKASVSLYDLKADLVLVLPMSLPQRVQVGSSVSSFAQYVFAQ